MAITSELKTLPGSEVEITAEIPADVFEQYRAAAVKKLGENLEVPGFRKGHAPEAVLLQKLGDMAVLEEMAEQAISEHYPELMKTHKVLALGRPSVSITKIAKGSPLGFTIKTAVLPQFDLPDYKKIAKEEMADSPTDEKDMAVTDKEFEELVERIKKERGHIEMENGNLKGENEKDGAVNEEKKEPKTKELTDEFVQELGDFKDVADFKKKLRENMALDKKEKLRQKKRMATLERILKETKIEVPEVLIESESERMLAQFKHDISRMGLKFEEYLKHIKKTEDDLKKEWRTDAEKRAATQLLLNMIADKETIRPDEERVNKEVAHIREHQKEASEEQVRGYVEMVLTNEAVLEFLEGQK